MKLEGKIIFRILFNFRYKSVRLQLAILFSEKIFPNISGWLLKKPRDTITWVHAQGNLPRVQFFIEYTKILNI